MYVRLVSSLGTGRSDGDSAAAEMERSHVLGGERGPLKPTSQSGGGMLGAGRPWERPCRGAEGTMREGK